MLTDRYELTMASAALADGTADRACVFEVFTRRLPPGRRFGVVAGTARVVDAVLDARFTGADLDWLRSVGLDDEALLEFLASWRFTGSIDGYREGELYFPGSPVLTVTGPFAEAVLLETFVLSALNHDSAIAAAAARMVLAAGGRPLVEMGSRRSHERAAVDAARAAWLAGFAATSNLAAGEKYGIPTVGTTAHAFTLLHDDERAAFDAQVAAAGPGTTLLVDTYDIRAGIGNAVAAAGPGLGMIRIDSGDLPVLAHQAREQLDALGATGTKILLSGDLDEYSLAGLGAAPVDTFGVGTSVVTGSGAPTAGFVFKLVEVEGRPVAKRSEGKNTTGGRKWAHRRHRETGTAEEEVVGTGPEPAPDAGTTALQVRFVTHGARAVQFSPDGARAGQPVALTDSREYLRAALVTLPWDGVKLSAGDPAIPTTAPGGTR